MNEDRVIEAPVIDYNKGGLIVDVGVRGFVPISQIPELRGLAKGPDGGDSPQVAERLAAMRGRVLKLKIIELNRARNRLILSERLAMQEERAGRKEALLHELEPGQIRTGRVTSLASFGAFVDLGGADGLVHISQLSYSRVNHPSEVLNVGDEVQVYVLSIDPQTKKIALSLKKAQPDPWTLVEERYKVGDVVEGTITKLAKFGAFARIDDGIEGLIHLSELTDEAGGEATGRGERGPGGQAPCHRDQQPAPPARLEPAAGAGRYAAPGRGSGRTGRGSRRRRGAGAATSAHAQPPLRRPLSLPPHPRSNRLPEAPHGVAAEPEAAIEPESLPAQQSDAGITDTTAPEPEASAAAPVEATPTQPTVEVQEPDAVTPPVDTAPPEATTAGDPGGGANATAPTAGAPEATASPQQHEDA